MNSRLLRGALGVACGGFILMQGACSDVKTLTPEDLVTSATLKAHFIPSGSGIDPCDDLAPIVDGQFFDYEWRDAEPLFVRMTGANGNGGRDFILEVRALWQDGRDRFGSIDRNRLYMMFRWGDLTQDKRPDLLVYGTPHPLTGVIVPSPQPRASRSECDVDNTLMNPDSWTRINADGAEDQLLVMIKEVDESLPLPDQTDGLADLNAEVFEILGPDGLEINSSVTHATAPTDVWIWRAGRTNDHPVYQRSKWESYEPDKRYPFGPIHHEVVDVPEPEFSLFTNFSGFFQDYFIDAGGMLGNDKGRDQRGRAARPAYIRNFGDTALPLRLTHPDPRVGGRGDGSQFDGFVLNGSLPVDGAMWAEQSVPFSPSGCDTIVPTRTEKNTDSWSENLVRAGLEYDFQFGWALQTPTGSRTDVRGMGVWNTLTDKIEPTWTVELQRDLDPAQEDDLVIRRPAIVENPDGTKELKEWRYLITLAVSDGDGRVCSGSYPILLEFEPRDPNATVFVEGEDKCAP